MTCDRKLGLKPPKIEDILGDIYGSKFFASMDCSSSFYILPMKKEFRHMLSFQFLNDKYQFRSCTQGLAGSPASFQKWTTGLIGALEHNGINSFVDDMLAHNPTWCGLLNLAIY